MIIKERKDESDSDLDNSSSSSRQLFDDTEEDLLRTRESKKKNTQASLKKSFQPANFGEYIESKINEFFDASNVVPKNMKNVGQKGPS